MASEQSKKAHVGAGERPVTLADLPGDVLAHVAELTGSKLGDALPRLRATSKRLAATIRVETNGPGHRCEYADAHAGHARLE